MQEVAQEVVNNYASLKYIGVGLCSIGMAGAAIAIGNIFGSFEATKQSHNNNFTYIIFSTSRGTFFDVI